MPVDCIALVTVSLGVISQGDSKICHSQSFHINNMSPSINNEVSATIKQLPEYVWEKERQILQSWIYTLVT